jgi:hypothetical protein
LILHLPQIFSFLSKALSGVLVLLWILVQTQSLLPQLFLGFWGAALPRGFVVAWGREGHERVGRLQRPPQRFHLAWIGAQLVA